MSDDLVKRMNDARDFPANTCGASRHAAMIAEALCKQEGYPMLAEEPEHCGGSIAATVAMLWECRVKLAKAVSALNVIDALDPETAINGFSESALRGLVLRMGELARTTLAELKVEDRG